MLRVPFHAINRHSIYDAGHLRIARLDNPEALDLFLNAPELLKAARTMVDALYRLPMIQDYEYDRHAWESLRDACEACEPVAIVPTPTDKFEMVVGRLEELICDLKKARG